MPVLGQGDAEMVSRGAVTDRRHSFLRELGRLGAGRVGGAMASALWFVVVVHHLSKNDVGDLALLLSLGAMFGILADGGYSIVLQAVVADNPGSSASAFAAVRTRRIPLGIAAAVLTGSIWLLTARNADPRVALVFAVSVLSTTVYTSAGITMRALGHAGFEGANETISRLGVLAAGWWLLDRHGGLLAAATVYALADLGSAIVLSMVFRRRFGHRVGPINAHALTPRRVAPVFLAAVLFTTYWRIDVLMVHVINGAAEAALYATSFKVFEVVMLPAGAAASLVVPAVFRAVPEHRAQVAFRITAAAVALTIVGGAIVEVFAPTLLRVIAGTKYLPATGSLRVLGAATVVTAATTVLAQVHAVWRPVRLAKVWVIALVANVGLNVILIPRYSAAGAAWATLLCQLAAAVVLIRDTRHLAAAGSEGSLLVTT
jgi:O-antigen/teichoic acid export membrane protein